MPAQTKKASGATKVAPRVWDLDAQRKARAEAREQEPASFVLGGETFTIPAELPVDFGTCLMEGDLRGAVVALLGGEQAERFFQLDPSPSVQDFEAIAEMASEVYGLAAGESKASQDS